MSAGILLLALLLDYCIGWPDQLFQRIGHPVTWLGRLINVLEQRFNARSETTRFAGRCFGLLTLFIVALLSGGIGWWLQQFFAESSWFWLIGAVAAWPWIAMRSMKEHVEAVAAPLTHQQLPEARYAVSMIVGRNPDNLDETGVARAALESLAENTSDGVIAPLFWALLCGLPGLFLYKSVNTLDSMIGHRN
ncbi:MAG: CobD/CbiB family cobalamin biosynthesis protein, partial [Pseudomonadota bacterium]